MLLKEQRCIDLFGKQISDYIITHESVNCWHSLSEDKVIENAKEKEISCADVLALIRGLKRNG